MSVSTCATSSPVNTRRTIYSSNHGASGS
jgi:hypothetical protein